MDDIVGNGTFRKDAPSNIGRAKALGIQQGKRYRNQDELTKKFLTFNCGLNKMKDNARTTLNTYNEDLHQVGPEAKKQNSFLELSAQQMYLNDIGQENFKKIKPKLAAYSGVGY